jgi:hypothetical protein
MFTPSPITLQPIRLSGLVVTADCLRSALQERGYDCKTSQLPRGELPPPGLSMVVQFGDTITVSAGKPALVVRCGVQMSDGRSRDVARWKIQKTIAVTEPQPFSIVIEADVVVSNRMVLSEVLSDEDDIYWHIGVLFNDLHGTLMTVPVSGRTAGEIPAARIEARFFGDVAAGRSGLAREVKGDRNLSLGSRQILQIMRTGCDFLRAEVFPELAGVIRGSVARTEESDGGVVDVERRGVGTQAIHRDHNEATLVPARTALP